MKPKKFIKAIEKLNKLEAKVSETIGKLMDTDPEKISKVLKLHTKLQKQLAAVNDQFSTLSVPEKSSE